MEITGIIRSIPFHNPVTGYGVFKTDACAIIGVAANASIGKRITAQGEPSIHPIYGDQLLAHTLRVENPTDVDGLKHMLTCVKIPGIGRVAANKLVDYFGVNVLKCLHDAEELKHAGMSQKQINALIEYYNETSRDIELLELLGSAGLGKKTIDAILRFKPRYMIGENPFKLLGKVPRLSFTNADSIWQVLHGENNADSRILAGVHEVMRRNLMDGHSGISYNNLVEQSVNLLSTPEHDVISVIDAHMGTSLIEFPPQSGVIYSRGIFDVEGYIAERLTRIHQNAPKLERKPDDISNLTSEQLSGVENAMNHGVSIITGTPGTGKTTVINALCKLAKANNISAVLLAPTGMAAHRMSKATKRPASTIHSLFKKCRIRKDSLIVVDESSMVSAKVLIRLLQKIRVRCRVVFVGDVNQLPSIEWGQVLLDLINSKRFPVAYLTKTFRFGDDIGTIARCVLTGANLTISDDVNKSTSLITCESDSEICETLMSLTKQHGQMQVLTPIKKGDAGTENLNSVLANFHNPNAMRANRLGVGIGDVVINTKNDYENELLNGSWGVVSHMDDNEITIDYEFVGMVTKKLEDATVKLAHALTAHKAQGQEYKSVAVVLPYHSPKMLQRRLVYTAITRAKDKLIIIAHKNALAPVLQGWFEGARITGLKHHIKLMNER